MKRLRAVPKRYAVLAPYYLGRSRIQAEEHVSACYQHRVPAITLLLYGLRSDLPFIRAQLALESVGGSKWHGHGEAVVMSEEDCDLLKALFYAFASRPSEMCRVGGYLGRLHLRGVPPQTVATVLVQVAERAVADYQRRA